MTTIQKNEESTWNGCEMSLLDSFHSQSPSLIFLNSHILNETKLS
jgi:hypothetical protein